MTNRLMEIRFEMSNLLEVGGWPVLGIIGLGRYKLLIARPGTDLPPTTLLRSSARDVRRFRLSLARRLAYEDLHPPDKF